MPGKKSCLSAGDFKALSFIFLLGLILRLIYILPLTYVPYSDAAAYANAARDLARGEGFLAEYEMAEQYPLYIYFLGGLFYLFGENYLLIRIVQAFLGALTGVLTFFLAKRITEDGKLGLIAGLVVALYPDLILHTGSLMTEPLYTFLLTLLLLTWHISLDQNSWSWRIITGLVMGLAYLTKAILIGFIPLALLWEWVKTWPSWRSALRSTLIIVVVSIGICAPWLVRNWSIYGTMFPPFPQLTESLWGGNNPQANGYWLQHPGTEEQKAYMATLSIPERRNYAKKQALTWIRENPGAFLKLVGLKISRLFSLKPDGSYKGNFYGKYAEALIPVIAKAVLWILVIVGLVHTFLFRKRLGLLYALFLSQVLITIIFFAYARYLGPLIPALAVLAAYGVKILFQSRPYFRKKPWPMKVSSWVTIALLVLLIGNWGWDAARNLGTFRVWQQVDSLKQFQRQTLEKLEKNIRPSTSP